MRKQKSCKPLLYLLLTGWCFLFLRCESTEKSMVRAVYLAQTEQGYQAGLLYQAPQAAADAAEASAALQFVQAEGQTMERALAAAEQALPQTASFRLCDYLLLPKAAEPLLTEYEQLVLRRGCGRTAARLFCAEGEIEHLTTQATLPDALMAQLKAAAPTAPRLYQHTEPGLLPVLRWRAAFCIPWQLIRPYPRNRLRFSGCLPGRAAPGSSGWKGSASASGAALFQSPCKRRRCLCSWTASAPPTAHCLHRPSSNNSRHSAPRFCKAAGSRAWMCCTCKLGQRCGMAAAQTLTQQKTPARNGGQTCISCCIKRR